MIRIVIADDSAFMRKLLSDLFTNEPDFTVIGTARNGKDAIEKIRLLKPDVVTMDVNMPVMDGLEALEVIMKECKIPVVMISSQTKLGADATIKALSLGAVDFIEKVSGPISSIKSIDREIVSKCRLAANANISSRLYNFNSLEINNNLLTNTYSINKTNISYSGEKLIAIGTSTGGPRALQEVITNLPKDLPCGVVIVQHMPAGFTKSLAERLNSLSAVTVKEAENNDIISAGKVFIAPGNYHMTVEIQGGLRMIKLNQTPPLANHRPAVDVLFNSVAEFGDKLIAVILTGMGSDGARGMKKIKEHGGYVIAEDQSTAVVYGMPKVVVDQNLADKVLPIYSVAGELIRLTK